MIIQITFLTPRSLGELNINTYKGANNERFSIAFTLTLNYNGMTDNHYVKTCKNSDILQAQ